VIALEMGKAAQLSEMYISFGAGTEFGPLNRYLGQKGYLQSLISLHRP